MSTELRSGPGTADSIIEWIERFCGQPAQPHEYIKTIEGHASFPATGIGHSQLNELLLALHLDRTTEDFFEYVFRGKVVTNFDAFKQCITEFRSRALLRYGNIKFAFKQLSQMVRAEIDAEIGRCDPNDVRAHYTQRHEPFVAIKPIPPKHTYYLGYVIGADLERRKKALQRSGGSLAEIEEQERLCADLRKIGVQPSLLPRL